MNPLFLCFITILAITSAHGTDPDRVINAYEENFNGFPDLSMEYTTENIYLLLGPDGLKTHDDLVQCKLRVSGDLFWLEEVGQSKLDPTQGFKFILAYDGKKFQVLNENGEMVMGSSSKMMLLGRLTTTPIVWPFLLRCRPRQIIFNSFEYLRNPANWLDFAKSLHDHPQVKPNIASNHLVVVNSNRTYEITLSEAADGYFPLHWKKLNGEGLPVVFDCSDIQHFTLGTRTFAFPMQLSETLYGKNGDPIQSKKSTILKILPLNRDLNDKSDFQISSSAAKTIYDTDIQGFVK